MSSTRFVAVTLSLLLYLGAAAFAQDYVIQREDGKPPMYLPREATLQGTYQRPMPRLSWTDPSYPNSAAVAHLIDPVTHLDTREGVNALGEFHFQGMQPGKPYYLAVVDSFSYATGYYGVRCREADPALGAEPMNGVHAPQIRNMFHAVPRTTDVNLSWHHLVVAPASGHFALTLNRDNADPKFTRAVLPSNPALVFRPARLIATGE